VKVGDVLIYERTYDWHDGVTCGIVNRQGHQYVLAQIAWSPTAGIRVYGCTPLRSENVALYDALSDDLGVLERMIKTQFKTASNVTMVTVETSGNIVVRVVNSPAGEVSSLIAIDVLDALQNWNALAADS